MPDPITITAEVRDSDAFNDALVNAAARIVLSRYSYDPDGNEHHLRSEIHSQLKSEVRDQLQTIARELAEPIVREVLDEPITETNSYGEPKGEPTTLRTIIVREVKQELLKPQRSHMGNRTETVLGKVVSEAVGHELDRELRAAVDAAKVEVVAAVKTKGAEVLAETMRRALPF